MAYLSIFCSIHTAVGIRSIAQCRSRAIRYIPVFWIPDKSTYCTSYDTSVECWGTIVQTFWMGRKTFVQTFWVQSKTFVQTCWARSKTFVQKIWMWRKTVIQTFLSAKQDFCSNMLGAKQDFCSKKLNVKEDFYSNIFECKARLLFKQPTFPLMTYLAIVCSIHTAVAIRSIAQSRSRATVHTNVLDSQRIHVLYLIRYQRRMLRNNC